MIPFAQTGGHEYQLDLAPVPALPDQHSLTITSTFDGAKDPRHKVKRFQCVTPRSDLHVIQAYLAKYLGEQP